MKVLTLCGSIRSRSKNRDAVLELANTGGPIREFIEAARLLCRQGLVLSNSEILAAAAMKGAIFRGADADYFSIKNLFDLKEKSVLELRRSVKVEKDLDELALVDTLAIVDSELDDLCGRIAGADGIILSTPVYFGDRSSVANKFLQITARHNLLHDKVFGVVSVGAKRNGGQETCNLYSMIEALNQNALVVGNGPPTSQYGGTAVGGNQGHVLDDEWGLETALGTGRKVAHVAEIYSMGSDRERNGPIMIDIMVTMDTGDRFFADYLEELVAKVKNVIPWAEFRMHELTNATIYRCLGCKDCPVVSGDSPENAQCRIKDPEDYLETLRGYLGNSDGVIVAGLNTLEIDKIIFRYQVITERMRYMRRNNFELTDLLFTGLCYNQFGAMVNPVHSIKTLTSYIRQNTTFYRPIEVLEFKGNLLEDGKDRLLDFCRAARRMKSGRKVVPRPESLYVAEGIAGGYK